MRRIVHPFSPTRNPPRDAHYYYLSWNCFFFILWVIGWIILVLKCVDWYFYLSFASASSYPTFFFIVSINAIFLSKFPKRRTLMIIFFYFMTIGIISEECTRKWCTRSLVQTRGLIERYPHWFSPRTTLIDALSTRTSACTNPVIEWGTFLNLKYNFWIIIIISNIQISKI